MSRRQKHPLGVGQLSLVEHALCPLDAGRSLQSNLRHECVYHFTDGKRRRRAAHVRILCPLGLSAKDEFYLWGLLALTFSQPQPDIELYATPHYCLRQLGVVDQHSRRGGRQYHQFRAALERLSAVRYQNDAFYDPVRAEHRRVSFGLLSYSLPLDPDSSRAWRIVWDPLLYELVSAFAGHLRFDLRTYRELDPASRRLFLLLSKVFRRKAKSPVFDLRYLGVQVLGYSPTIAVRDLKVKVARSIGKLAERGVVRQADSKVTFFRKANDSVLVRFDRGQYFDQLRGEQKMSATIESGLVEPLRAIGVEERAIGKILKTYPVRTVQEWLDITLAAKERFGPEFFKRSPAAFFIDNVRNAAAGKRTPPDWWHEIRRAEQRGRARCVRARARRNQSQTPATSNVRPSAESDGTLRLTLALQAQFEGAGQPADVARRHAERFAREYARACGSDDTDQIERLLQLLA